jgi:secondary thiamine-phosphate synthase enzyme
MHPLSALARHSPRTYDPLVKTGQLSIDTATRKVVDLTDAIRAFCAREGDGLLNVFVPHSTAGLAIMELGSQSDADLEGVLNTLLPRDDRYRHAHGTQGHGADHLLPAFLAPSVTIPVTAGRPMLGTWQSVVLVDLNVDNPTRQVQLSLLQG